MDDRRFVVVAIVLKTVLFATLFAFLYWMIGNPIGDVLFQFFSEETEAHVIDAYDYQSEDMDPRYSIRYTYEVGGKRYEDEKSDFGFIQDPLHGRQWQPQKMVVEYLPFWPSMSRLRHKLPLSMLEFFIQWIVKVAFYIGLFAMYWNLVRDDFRNFRRNFIRIYSPENIRWKYQWLSLFLDFIFISLSVGLFLAIGMSVVKLSAQKGETIQALSMVFAGMLMFCGFGVAYFLTRRLEWGVDALVYGGVVVYIVLIHPSLSQSITEWLVGEVSEYNWLVNIALITIFKWLLEIFFASLSLKIEYPVIEWIEEKWKEFFY